MALNFGDTPVRTFTVTLTIPEVIAKWIDSFLDEAEDLDEAVSVALTGSALICISDDYCHKLAKELASDSIVKQ